MAEVNFYLNKSKMNRKNEAPILLQFTNRGKKMRFYIGEKIALDRWNPAKQKAKSYAGSGEFNDYLDTIRSTFKRIYRDALTNNIEPTKDYLKAEFDKWLRKEKYRSFFDLFEDFIEITSSTKTKGTIKNYRNSLHYLEEYASHKSTSLDFAYLDNSFAEDFIDYLITQEQLSNNTIGRIIKNLKTFLKWVENKNIKVHPHYKDFKVFRENVEIIYLTDQEIERLLNLELDDEKEESLIHVRDVFCFGCFTGLRFSDIQKISQDNVMGDYLVIRIQKTKDHTYIPLIDRAKEILEKYDYSLPVIVNQKTNFHLKKLGQKAELDEVVVRTKYKGSRRIDERVPKWKMLTTHTARRTFITLSLEKGMRPEVVMEITGHKDYKSFKKYIKITSKITKTELLNAWNK